jgi:6-phosphogluconolactonase (cycloisomerase 2 family)
VIALVFGLLLPFAAQGANAARPDVVGHVYVNNNTSVHNSISGFDRHADGSLTPIAGSPFMTGGVGTGADLASQGALQFSGDGRYVVAVDAGSNQVSTLRIHHDGSLQLADTVSSGGEMPLSVTVHGNLVYVANAGAAGRNYTGFTLNAGGHLQAIAGSTVALSGTAAPVDILFNGNGTLLVATKFGPGDSPSQIDGFAVTAGGLLVAAPASPFAAQGLAPFGSAFRPNNSSQLFVSNAHNGANLGTVSAFNVAGDGTLSSITNSPFADLQTAPCWVDISPDGQHLFTVNTAVPSITSFAIATDGTLSNPTSVLLNSPAGLRPFDIRVAPSGDFLYVVGAKTISAFSVTGGSLTELAASPVSLPAGAVASGIIVD